MPVSAGLFPSPQAYAWVEVEPGRRPDGTVWARLSGDFDIDAVPVLKAALAEGGDGLVLDVSAVTFADCSFLNALLDIRPRPVLAGTLPPLLARLFELTGVTAVFTHAPPSWHPAVPLPFRPADPSPHQGP
ncbi:STAS domain-containing protein [Streptomyces sp. NPDC097619]|uniref:STAS domain-containing protein n=1 Tax=Streptomyces sp. NPDC097619 TaxID=3157228 RepID=UPI003327F36F